MTVPSRIAIGFAAAILCLGAMALYAQADASPAAEPAWQLAPTPTENRLLAISMLSASEGWAVGDAGTVLQLEDGAWHPVITVTLASLQAVEAVATKNIWVVGTGGAIVHYDGKAWYLDDSPTAVTLRGVSFSGAGDGWAVGDGGTILHFVDGTWSVAASPVSDRLYAVEVLTSDTAWAVGVSGTVLQLVAGTWQKVSAPAGAAFLRSVDFVDPGDGWAVGYEQAAGAYDATILHYSGGTWQRVTTTLDNQLQSVSMVSAGDGWIVGDGGVMLHYERGAWTELLGPQCFAFLRDVELVGSGEGWAVGQSAGYTGAAILHFSTVREPTPTPRPTRTPTPSPSGEPGPHAPLLPPPGVRPLATLAPAERAGYYDAPPAWQLQSHEDYLATFHTEVGDFKIALYTELAPFTVNNFVVLAVNGYFDHTTFHRVLAGFVAQGGDPSGSGSGDPGYSFDDEFACGLKFDRSGRLAMANAGPNTNGSQFFITYAQTPWLYGNHSIFGQVVEGMDVVEEIRLRDPSQNPDFDGTQIYRVDITGPGLWTSPRLFVPIAYRQSG